MTFSHSKFKFNIILAYFLASVIIILSLPITSFALTPIAHTDVVPYQRINYGTTFNFGVVAFSKSGIDQVEFEISGQGYIGGRKFANTMRLNKRLAHSETSFPKGSWPGVYEYYVEIASSEFKSNGPIKITPTVYGEDGDKRALAPVTLIVEATKSYKHTEAWVNSANGNDSTGKINDPKSPYKTIGGAAEDAEKTNGGSSDGNIIYLNEGTYDLNLKGYTPSTNFEWLTIRAVPGADRDKVIIDDGGSISRTKFLKFEGLSLYSGGNLQYVINSEPENLWVHNCKMFAVSRLASGAGTGGVLPVKQKNNFFSTNNYVYNVDRAYGGTKIVRNATIYHTSEDVFQNCYFVVNVRVDDVDPEGALPTYPHADGFQLHSGAPKNIILYNYFGTNLHYQGTFLRNTGGAADGVALVNVFVEMREPGRQGYAGGNTVLSPGSIYVRDNDWNHFLMWHCSFPYKSFNFYNLDKKGEATTITNSSLIGNIFWEFRTASDNVDPPSFGYRNTKGNEVLYNHYKSSTSDLLDEGCYGKNAPTGCPQVFSKSPDSDSPATQSHGGMNHPEVLNLTDKKTYRNFGYPDPDAGSILIDRLPTNLTGIPADALGNLRDSRPDVGALESGVPGQGQNPPDQNLPSIPNGGAPARIEQ